MHMRTTGSGWEQEDREQKAKQMWQCMSIIPVLRRLRQENCEFETSLGYRARHRERETERERQTDRQRTTYIRIKLENP
jgi:hypothetical protein